MWKFTMCMGVFAIVSGCAGTPDAALKPTPILRGVDSDVQQSVDQFYSVKPDCSNPGYPEIRTLNLPGHGTLAVQSGEVYPSFAKDNVRYECNKTKVASTVVLYKSNPGFHGKDFFTIQVRFENSTLRSIAYHIDVF